MESAKIRVVMPTRSGNPNQKAFWFAMVAANHDDCSDNTVNISQNGFCVAAHRNKIVREFLKTDSTHLLAIDEDIVVQADAITLLREMDTDIAAGCCPFVLTTGPNERIVINVQSNGYWCTKWFNGPMQIEACGMGCALIGRNVFEKMEPPWFEWPQNQTKKRFVGEDIRFCQKARELGFEVMAHGNVRCSHYKSVDLAGFVFDPPMVSDWTGPKTNKEQAIGHPYGSHAPALFAIGTNYPHITNITEFGSGKYSTPLLLNKEVFPHVTDVFVYESEECWINEVKHNLPDERLHMAYAHLSTMPERAGVYEPADFIFIDCGADYEDDDKTLFNYGTRIALLKQYSTTNAIVAVHDSDNESIQRATRDYKHRVQYDPPYGPPTLIMSNKYDVLKDLKHALHRAHEYKPPNRWQNEEVSAIHVKEPT